MSKRRRAPKNFGEFFQNVVGQSIEKSSDFHSALFILLLGGGYLVWRGEEPRPGDFFDFDYTFAGFVIGVDTVETFFSSCFR